MAEKPEIFLYTSENTCSTCLRTTNEVNPMTTELKNEYYMFVEGIKEEAEMMICNICTWIFRRFLKFKKQCLAARTVLTEAAQMDIKPMDLIQNLTLCHNLKESKPTVHFYNPNNVLEDTWSRKYNGMWNNTQNAMSNTQNAVNNTQNAVNNAHNAVNNAQNALNNTQDIKSDDDGVDNSVFDNDYNIPVLRNGKVRKKSRKSSVKADINFEFIIQNGSKRTKANGSNAKTKRSKSHDGSNLKKPKVLKEGFSSRMVQETDEYVVIKLSKEQVLQEMDERSKTEAYIQSPYKCEKCVKGFNFEDVLRTHTEKHSMENGSFKCDMCSQNCRSSVSLRGHVKSHTTRYKCKLCGVVRLSRQHLLEHYAITHTRQPVTYTCDTCQFHTNKRTIMQRHVKSHVVTEPHTCDKCGKLFKSLESLRVHTIRHDKSSRLQCMQCDVSFVYRSLLRRHIERVHNAKEYYCVECDTHYNSSESLRLHFKKAKRHRDPSLNTKTS